MATSFANPERQFRAKRDISPALIHNIYTFYETESFELESEYDGEIDIETLILEQYITLNNTHRRISNPENATFEIKGQFLRELRKTTFSGSFTENAIEHIEKVLEIATSKALKSIQELADHSHKWHNEESKNTPTPFSIIAEKLKALNHEMDELRVDVRKINTNREMKSLHEEIKRLGNPKLINMVIEMADRSMQSPEGIFEKCAGSARLNDDFSGTFCNPNSNSSISMDDFVKMDDVWDNLDFRDLANEATKFPVKPKIHQFLIDFIIPENINDIMEKGLTEVLFGQPFEEHVGIIDDRVNGVLWFKIKDDKTIFNMPVPKKDLVLASRRQLSRPLLI
uniref:Uncharacterized protein n=1 Tax=Tanacetum cinerariifolium TaxID=118510 RepID=A0A6L2L8D9_TANCI|nr:hypothetical protein [Tanacetum cinerariifolium]